MGWRGRRKGFPGKVGDGMDSGRVRLESGRWNRYAGSVSNEMISIQLPDGSVREVPRGTTPFDVATSISPRLAAAVVVARVRPLVDPTLRDKAAKDGASGAGE